MPNTDLIRQQPDLNLVQYTDMYFSGAQTKVFFGNVWVDEVVTISWDLVEQKAPLYGYASDKYDAIARGTQIVQGVFTVAFKDRDYINTILDYLNTRGESGESILKRVKQNKARKAYEQRAQSSTQFGPALPKFTNYDRILDEALKQDSGADFHGMKTYLEDRIWGQVAQGLREQALDKDKSLQTIVSGFDIEVIYGNISNASNEWTVKSIGDCHITGIRQLLTPNGEPLFEAYTFFGKMMDPYHGQEGQTLQSERASDPFGSQYSGSNDADNTDQVGETLDTIEIVVDSDGNPVDDDPASTEDNALSNLVLSGVVIEEPIEHLTISATNGTFPLIAVQAKAVGVPDGLQNNVKFHWAVHYENHDPSFFFNLGYEGRTATIDFTEILQGYPITSGNGYIYVIASYNGTDVRSNRRTFSIS